MTDLVAEELEHEDAGFEMDASIPFPHTMALLNETIMRLNQWFQQRSAPISAQIQVVNITIQLVLVIHDEYGRSVSRNAVVSFDSSVDYSKYAIGHVIQMVFTNIFRVNNKDLIDIILRPVQPANLPHDPLVGKQHFLGMFYTNGTPFLWYMSRTTGRLFVYETNTGASKIVAEFIPYQLLMNEGKPMAFQTLNDLLACDALKIMRTKEYTEGVCSP